MELRLWLLPLSWFWGTSSMTDYRRQSDDLLPRLDERVRALTDSVLLLRHAVNDMDARSVEAFRRVEERIDAVGWVSQQQFQATLRGYVTQRSMVAWILATISGMAVATWGAMLAFGSNIITALRSP